MYHLVLTPDFQKQLQHFLKGNSTMKGKVAKSFKELLTDPDHPALRTHKLENEHLWSLSVDMSIRITFTIQDDEITFITIGSHDQAYQN